MKIAVRGGDGYCSLAKALYLSQKDHTVAIIDGFVGQISDHDLWAQKFIPVRPVSQNHCFGVRDFDRTETLACSASTFGARKNGMGAN
jgi:hypothetical protein